MKIHPQKDKLAHGDDLFKLQDQVQIGFKFKPVSVNYFVTNNFFLKARVCDPKYITTKSAN